MLLDHTNSFNCQCFEGSTNNEIRPSNASSVPCATSSSTNKPETPTNASTFGMTENEELFTAAQTGNLPTLMQLKTQGVDMSAKNAKGQTIGHIAAKYGHLEVLKWLFQHGLDLNVKDKYGETPVHLAAENGYLEVLEWLFQHGFELNVKNKNARTPVHLTVENGHLEVLKWLFEQGLDLNVKDKFGKTPVHFAALNGHLEVLKWLKAQKLNLNEAAELQPGSPNISGSEVIFEANPPTEPSTADPGNSSFLLPLLRGALESQLVLDSNDEKLRTLLLSTKEERIKVSDLLLQACFQPKRGTSTLNQLSAVMLMRF
jgi:ankyrin repeat protein